MFTTTAYNTLGEPQETETHNDSWSACEMCLDLSMLYGYAERLQTYGVVTLETTETDPQH